MDTPVVPAPSARPEIAALEESTEVVLPVADRAEPAPAVRRFRFDPASSPLLAAALAWDAAGPRR